MTKVCDFIFWVAAAILVGLVAFSLAPAHAGERVDIFNNRGERQGYVKPSPYSGRCCVVYNEKGERQGYVRSQRPGVDRNSIQAPKQNSVQGSKGKR